MPSHAPMTACGLARLVGGALVGPDRAFGGVAPLDTAGPDEAAWCDGPARGSAGVLLLREAAPGRTCVEVADPRLAFAALLAHLFPELHEPGVHPGAFVHPTARLGQDVVVYPGAYVGARCEVGDRTVLFPNAVLYPDTVLGPDCRVHAGAVLGADGFSYHPTASGPAKVPQVGRVRAGARVEIGANTCVDRAALDETVLGDDSKLDNLVQVGHNCRLGRSVVAAAQTGLSGSVTLGDGVVMGGQAGVADHVTIGPGARVGARTGVHRDLEGGKAWLGVPAMPARQAARIWAALKELPALLERVRALERAASRPKP